MCGRISRARRDLDYIEPLMMDFGQYDPEIFRPSWNVAPGSLQPILEAQGARLEHWGYHPHWSKKMMINATIEKAGSPTWRRMWAARRVIVPCDAWYEWVQEGGQKQPYLIRRADAAPLYLAGLYSVKPGSDVHESDGFVIVTDAADAGLIDLHDRRPLVLSAGEAKEWLNPDLDFEAVTHIAHNASTPADAYEWYPVSKEVNNYRNNDPSFNDRI